MLHMEHCVQRHISPVQALQALQNSYVKLKL